MQLEQNVSHYYVSGTPSTVRLRYFFVDGCRWF